MQTLLLVLMGDLGVSTSRTESREHLAACRVLHCLMAKAETCRTNPCEQGRCIFAIQRWFSGILICPKLRHELWHGEPGSRNGRSNLSVLDLTASTTVTEHLPLKCLRCPTKKSPTMITMIRGNRAYDTLRSVVGTDLIIEWKDINYLRSQGFLTMKQIETLLSIMQRRLNYNAGGTKKKGHSVKLRRSTMRWVVDFESSNASTTTFSLLSWLSTLNQLLATRSLKFGINPRVMMIGRMMPGLLLMCMITLFALHHLRQ